MSERPNINIRVSPDEKKEIEAMCEDAGIPPATLAKKCLLSALDYYREKGDIPLPPAIVRQQEAVQLAEDPIDTIERLHKQHKFNRSASELLAKLKEQERLDQLHNKQTA